MIGAVHIWRVNLRKDTSNFGICSDLLVYLPAEFFGLEKSNGNTEIELEREESEYEKEYSVNHWNCKEYSRQEIRI